MTAAKATLPQVTGQTAPEVPPPTVPGGRTSEKTRARLSDLRPHPRNPRRISPARLVQLQRTLEAEPDMLDARPLICLPDGTVVAGNQRLAAAAALGWESIPVVYADLSPEEVTRWMLLDNRGFGEDDRDAVAQLLGELEAADSDLELTGYDPADLDAMLRELHRPSADPDDAPEPPEEPRSERGRVYELGPHRVMCGDATSADDVSALVGTQPAAVMVTDPPYGIGVDHTWRDGLVQPIGAARTGLVTNDDRFDWEGAYLLTDAPIAYVWHSAFFAAEVKAGLAAAKFEVRQQIIWVKTVHALSRSAYHWKHETCWYAVRKGATANWQGGRSQSTVWEAAAPNMSYGGGIGDDERTPHPTQKPIAIIEPAIANHTGRGNMVYDPFAGSGTTLIAAERLGRRCFAMEIDPAYVDVIRQRYADYVGRPELEP